MAMVTDPRLDRRIQFDEQSRQYNIRSLIQGASPRSYTWPLDLVLDQGHEGACVGFSIAHELRAIPFEVDAVNTSMAQRIYHRARQLDPWPGEAYEGTSVLAGIKAAQELGYYSEYRWSFNIDDLAVAVSRTGPAIIGINWYSAMYRPLWEKDRFWVRPEGDIVGGHAIVVRGYNIKRDAFALHNSWGPGWGKYGVAWITRPHLKFLLDQQGEAVIPLKR